MDQYEDQNVVPYAETEPAQITDFWGAPPPPEKYYLPDGKQWIEFTKLTHGERTVYSSRTNREMVIERKSGNARMKTDLMGDTNILLDIAIKDWYILRAGQVVPFSKGSPGSHLSQFLAQADPALVDGIEKAVRDANPWLLGEGVTEEALEEQIKDLTEQLHELRNENAAKNS